MEMDHVLGGGPVPCWPLRGREAEMDHVFGGGPVRSLSFCGRFRWCVTTWGLGVRGVRRVQCRQACGTRIPEPGLAGRFGGEIIQHQPAGNFHRDDFSAAGEVAREAGRRGARTNRANQGSAFARSRPRGEADEPATSVAARAKTSSLKPRDLHEWCDVAITYCSLPEFPAQLCSLYTPWTISPGCTRYRQPPFGVRSDTHKRSRAQTGCCRKRARSTPRSC